MITTRRTILKAATAALITAALARRAAADDAPAGDALPPDALTPVRERYATLQSYADTGTVLTEQQWEGSPVVAYSGSFTTFYRAPRMFFFEFVEDPATGDDRLVIWCDGGDFQSWWKTTRQHEVYDGGRGGFAFLLGQEATMGSSNIVPSLLFPAADLGGAVSGLREARDAGEEEVDGRRFARIDADTIVAGSMVRTRPTKLWLDPETRLLHKVVEDTPPGEAELNRRTTILAPQADIEIEDSRFTFAVPG